MFSKKRIPEEVFTPKGSVVNKDMYIERPQLEAAFKKGLRKPKHIILHGESGSGKTWLYKKIFQEMKIDYHVLNAASINSLKSISLAISSLTARITPIRNTGYEEKIKAEANAIVMKGALEHTEKYEFQSTEPFLELLKKSHELAGGKNSFIVIDNLEHIVRTPAYIKELSALILYLDDEAYAKYNVRLLLVGTPSDIRDYFSSVDESQTIINRLQELPEVSILSPLQTMKLVSKGMFDLLGIKVIEEKKPQFNTEIFLNDICWFTANVPQYIHELCLEISIEAANNDDQLTRDVFARSLFSWVKEALVSEHTRVEANVNSIETKVGRKNQVIYSLSAFPVEEFSYQEIEATLRANFPNSTKNKILNVSAMLSELAGGTHPIIRKTPKGNQYRFIDPKIKIMTRWMLNKNGEEKVSIRKFDDSIKF